MKIRTACSSIIIFGIVLCFAAVFFTFIFYYDNKYTDRVPVSQDGILSVTRQNLAAGVSLADGWELYPDRLLSPSELSAGDIRPTDAFVGEYLTLSSFHSDGDPYGSATWRLRFSYSGPEGTASLLLPEVFCAFRLYINGRLAAECGSTQPYAPFVRDTAVSFSLAKENEIVLQTINATHYYSGLTYPPVLGTAQTVGQLRAARLAFYGLLCFGTLAAAVFSAAFWMGKRQKRNSLIQSFGVLALAFSVWTAHAFIWTFGTSAVNLCYALEDAAFLLLLWGTFCIALQVCGLSHTRFAHIISRTALTMVFVGGIIPLFILPVFPAFAAWYGTLVTVYRFLSAGILTALSFYGTLRGKDNMAWIFAGSGFYGAGILAGALTVSTFEPMRFGWMEEYGALALVVCFGILVVRRSYAVVQENLRLTQHLQEEVERQTHDIRLMVSEREDLISRFLHDMKSPAAFMLSYAQMVRSNNVQLDEQTRKQLAVIEEKCGMLSDRIRQVQQYAAENRLITPRKRLDLCVFLRDLYRFNKPDVEMDGQIFSLELPKQGACTVYADPEKLTRLVQNLLYNAVSFTPPGGSIILSLSCRNGDTFLSVRDTGSGIPKNILPRVFDRFFTTRSADGGTGMGLYIVRTVAQEYGGDVSVQSEEGHGTEFTVRLPLAE